MHPQSANLLFPNQASTRFSLSLSEIPFCCSLNRSLLIRLRFTPSSDIDFVRFCQVPHYCHRHVFILLTC